MSNKGLHKPGKSNQKYTLEQTNTVYFVTMFLSKWSDDKKAYRALGLTREGSHRKIAEVTTYLESTVKKP